MSERQLDNIKTQENEITTVETVLNRRVDTVFPEKGLREELEMRRIRLYLGIDPTSPDLHFGHTVPLRKLREFQDLGHEVILLFGTFTALVGDPTERASARKRMAPEEIETNIRTYAEQAGKILDLSPEAKNPITIRHNDEWLGRLSSEDWLNLLSKKTVQNMIERRGFRERWDAGDGIYVVEIIYPFLQGWDAVAMEVDLEIGGKDQLFNMLVGRDFVREELGKEKWVMGLKLLEDPTGKKMGKTEGQVVNLNEWPEVQYEAVMKFPDSAIVTGFELLTSIPDESLEVVREIYRLGEVHPMNLKEALAFRVVAELNGLEAAEFAQTEFDRVLRGGNLPGRIKEVQILPGERLQEILVSSGLASSVEEAQSRISQGSVYIDGKQTKSANYSWGGQEGLISIGKKTIRNIRLVSPQ